MRPLSVYDDLGRLPADWIGAIVQPRPAPSVGAAPALIAAALSQPIGCPPLAEWVRPEQRVAILVDDFTRQTPIAQMLPPVLDTLRAAGVPDRQISLVVASGTHRPMTQAELALKLGAPAVQRCRVVQVSGADEADFVHLGSAAAGLPAYVHQAVVQADVRIGLGMITPHLDAGFSGGMKIVLPGVCGARTVDAFHRQSAFVEHNQLGRLDAPLRRTLEQFVSAHAPLTFIVNAVLTPDERLYACVAGHPLHAQRAGVRHALAVFRAPAPRRYPIVVADCRPYDIDLWQSVKGMWAGDLLTADGGVLIAVTAAPEGNSSYPLLPGYIGRPADDLKREIEAGAALDDKQAATGVMFRALLQRIRLVLVSHGLTAADAGRMGVDYYPSLPAAVAAEIERLPAGQRPGSIGVLPQAGIVLPVVE